MAHRIIQKVKGLILKVTMRQMPIFAFFMIILLFIAPSAYSIRLKDMADIKGVRENQLVGYGLVVGLKGTGDGKKSLFTVQSMVSLLEKMGISIGEKEIAVKKCGSGYDYRESSPFCKSRE